jgi:ABC-type transporter Mla subunit MlaD
MYVPEAEAVSMGTPVLLDGLSVGSVSKVKLAGKSVDPSRRIEVVLRIEKRFQNLILDDSTASLVRNGLLGVRNVNIARGLTGIPVNAGGEIRISQVKEETLSLGDFIDALGKKANCQNQEENPSDTKAPTSTKNPQKPH